MGNSETTSKDTQITIYYKAIRFFVSLITAFLFEKNSHKEENHNSQIWMQRQYHFADTTRIITNFEIAHRFWML